MGWEGRCMSADAHAVCRRALAAHKAARAAAEAAAEEARRSAAAAATAAEDGALRAAAAQRELQEQNRVHAREVRARADTMQCLQTKAASGALTACICQVAALEARSKATLDGAEVRYAGAQGGTRRAAG